MVKVNTDLAKILTPEYSNKWVALDERQTKIVVVGKKPGEVLEKAKKRGFKNPVVTFVIKDYGSLVS